MVTLLLVMSRSWKSALGAIRRRWKLTARRRSRSEGTESCWGTRKCSVFGLWTIMYGYLSMPVQTRTRIFVLSQHSSVTHMEEMGSHSHVCPYSFLSAPRNPTATCVSLPWGWSSPVHGSRKQLPASIVFVSHCRHLSTDPALRLRPHSLYTRQHSSPSAQHGPSEAGSRQGVVSPPPRSGLSSSMNNGPNTSELSPHLVQRHRLRENVGEVVLARHPAQSEPAFPDGLQAPRTLVSMCRSFSHARSIRDGSWQCWSQHG